jgi:hypothetical protein
LNYQAEATTSSSDAMVRRATTTYYKRMMRNYSAQTGMSQRQANKENAKEMKQLNALRDGKFKVCTAVISSQFLPVYHRSRQSLHRIDPSP